jgi:hypothetical protein
LAARLSLSWLLGDLIDDWPPLLVEIIDRENGRVVYRQRRPMGSGDAAGTAAGIDRDLESLDLEAFCERYGIRLP